MALTIPRIFRKPYTEKKLKKLLKFIEQDDDKKFLVSCFRADGGVYLLKPELWTREARTASAKTLQRLKVLAKAIKVNRQGPVRILPLAACGILVAGLALFFTTLMDPLLEGLLERGLENVFEAKCDVNKFHLGLLRFRISMGSVTVANRDKPMTNLFETGRIELRLKPQAVLRGKVYIEELRADSLRFGTARKVSGALPQYAAKIAARKEKPPAPPLVDLKNFDAAALLDREYAKLAAPKAFEQATAAYNEAKARWENQYTRANERVAELRSAVQPLANFNINNIKTPEEAVQLVSDINTMITTVETARNEVNLIVNGVQGDVTTAHNLERTAREAVQSDLDHLKSYLDLGSGSALKALEPSIREVLSDEAEAYIAYGQRGLEALEKIKALQAKIPKSEPKPKKQEFKGRVVPFPTQEYPVFYLGIMASDFTLGSWNWGFDLRHVSSSPDLSNKPVELNLALTEESSPGRKARVEGKADFRSRAQEYFNVLVTGNNFPVDIRGDLSAAGIGGFSGTVHFNANLAGGRGGAASGGGGIDIREPKLVDPSGTAAEAVAEVLAERNTVNLGVQYTHPAAGDDTFALTTNIGELVSAALKRIVERYLKQAQDAIEKALREKLSGYLDGKWVSREDLDNIFAVVKGDQTALDKLKASLEEKKNEAERKIRGAAEEAVDKAKDEAKRQAEEAAKKAIDSIKPPGIKLPF